MDILDFASSNLNSSNDNIYYWSSEFIHNTTYELLRLARWINDENLYSYQELLKRYLERDYTHYVSIALLEKVLEKTPEEIHQLIKEKVRNETQF